MEFDIAYTSKEITPWGGMVFMKQMLQNIGFRELIENNADLPVSGSNRGYKKSTIVEVLLQVFGVVPIGFYILKSHGMMQRWERFLAGPVHPAKIHINAFSQNSPKQQTKK